MQARHGIIMMNNIDAQWVVFFHPKSGVFKAYELTPHKIRRYRLDLAQSYSEFKQAIKEARVNASKVTDTLALNRPLRILKIQAQKRDRLIEEARERERVAKRERRAFLFQEKKPLTKTRHYGVEIDCFSMQVNRNELADLMTDAGIT